MLGTAQSGLARSASTPLLSQNAGPIQQGDQTAAMQSLRSSLLKRVKHKAKDTVNTLKSSVGSFSGTIGRSLSRSTRRRQESIAGSVFGDGSLEESTAGRNKKNKKHKKSSPTLNTVFTRPRERMRQ